VVGAAFQAASASRWPALKLTEREAMIREMLSLTFFKIRLL